jgi:hypothetical protein
MREEYLLIVAGAIFLWLISLTFLWWKVYSHYQKLTKNVNAGDLKKLLEEHLVKLKLTSDKVEELTKRCDIFDEKIPRSIQKVGLIRCNPYQDVGGDQSFSLALLDKNGDGVVVSALHNREATRMYAKPVVKGKEGKYTFSQEEKSAIEVADKIIS